MTQNAIWPFLVGGSAVVATAAGVLYYVSSQNAQTSAAPATIAAPVLSDPVAQQPAPQTARAPETSESDATEKDTAQEPDPMEVVVPLIVHRPPALDVVRIDPQGGSLVAGAAEPGWDVAILVDNSEIARVQSDANGKFAALFDLAPSAQPRALQLLGDPDGEGLLSQETYLIAPFGTQEPTPESGPEATASPELVAETDAISVGEDVVALVEPDKVEVVTEPVGEDTAPSELASTQDSPAVQAPPVLVADDEGVRVISSIDVMSNVALDAITYDPSGDVVLAGRAVGEGFVQVYLDNQPITTSIIEQDGVWRTDLPEVDTGVYTLRVDEVDAQGQVVSRIETPFLREEPEVVIEALADDVAQEDFTVAMRTVQPGNTLWAIAQERYGDGVLYARVFEANQDQIRDPDLIYPGQIFELPTLSDLQ